MSKMIFVALFFIVFLSGCAGTLIRKAASGEILRGSGQVVTETREVSGFNAVTLQGMGQVLIDQTGSESLTIRADDNFLPYIITEVRDGTLFISGKDQVVFTDAAELTIEITAAELERAELAGAGSFKISNLDTDTWSVKLPGAGSFDVSGRTVKQTIQLDGAGSYNAENLESQEAVIHSSGAGTAVVRVSDKLEVTIDGLGSVEYIGNPQVTQTINGLGTVRQR